MSVQHIHIQTHKEKTVLLDFGRGEFDSKAGDGPKPMANGSNPKRDRERVNMYSHEGICIENDSLPF
jgi:hypothetical protein